MAGTPGIAPSGWPGTLEWWSAPSSAQTVNSDGTGGAPADGGAVGRITGLIGGNFMIQATGANKPVYSAAANPIGGPAWTFDGLAKLMTCDGLAASFAGADLPLTVIAVVGGAPAGTATKYFSLAANTATQPFSVYGNSVSSTWQTNRQGDTGAAVAVAGGDYTTGFLVLGFRFDGTRVSIWKNRREITPWTAQDVADCTFTQLTMGCIRRAANTQFWPGTITELAIGTQALNDYYMEAAMTYFTRLYGQV